MPELTNQQKIDADELALEIRKFEEEGLTAFTQAYIALMRRLYGATDEVIGETLNVLDTDAVRIFGKSLATFNYLEAMKAGSVDFLSDLRAQKPVQRQGNDGRLELVPPVVVEPEA